MKIKHIVFLVIVATVCFVNIITTSSLSVGIVNSICLIVIATIFIVLIKEPDFFEHDEEYMVESTIKLQKKKDVSTIQD